MKIRMEVEQTNYEKVDYEEYIIDDNLDPYEYSSDMIDNFNKTLRPGESPRKLLGVEVIDETIKNHKHDWQKQNFITIISGHSNYDIYKCSKCGVTGKRYRLSDVIVNDKEYKAKKYKDCGWRQE